MTGIVGTLAAAFGGTLLKMATSLMTERFIKKMVVQALSVIVKRTATQEDDKFLADAKKEWGID